MTFLPVVTENQIGPTLHRRKFCDGAPYGSDVFYDEKLYKKQVRNRAPESRPKPESLLENMTALDMAYTMIGNAGLSHAVETIPCSSFCPGKSTQATHLYEYPLDRLFGRAVTRPAPDWITPLRMQLQNMYVNLGADVAEYKQTTSMFHDAGTAVLNGWRHLKGKHRGSRRRKKLSLCHVADAELIYSFGIAPLVGSLYNSYDALKHRIDGPIFFKFLQQAELTEEGEVCINGKHQHTEWYIQNFAKVYVQFRPGAMITIGNPISIAWELVPYSFLFDYMIPIGETLMALDALKGVEEMYGTLTTRQRITDSLWYDQDAWSSGYIVAETKKSKETIWTHDRQVLSDIPLPPFPRWKPSASFKKLQHSVSLLIGANQRCRSRSRVPERGRGGFGRKR